MNPGTNLKVPIFVRLPGRAELLSALTWLDDDRARSHHLLKFSGTAEFIHRGSRVAVSRQHSRKPFHSHTIVTLTNVVHASIRINVTFVRTYSGDGIFSYALSVEWIRICTHDLRCSDMYIGKWDSSDVNVPNNVMIFRGALTCTSKVECNIRSSENWLFAAHSDGLIFFKISV